MRPSDAAELLGVHPRTVVRWGLAGRLVMCTTASGQHLLDRQDVLALALKRIAAPPVVSEAARHLAEQAHRHSLTRLQAYAVVDGWWPGDLQPGSPADGGAVQPQPGTASPEVGHGPLRRPVPGLR